MADIYAQLFQIYQSKYRHDSLLSDMKLINEKLTRKNNYSLAQIKQESSALALKYNDIKIAIKKNMEALSDLRVRFMRLKTYEGRDMSKQQALYENLLEYFMDLDRKSRELYGLTNDKVAELEKMHLLSGASSSYNMSDTVDSLEFSNQKAAEAVEVARGVMGSLKFQESMLQGVRTKMGVFFGEMNLSRTLTRMIENRSSEDYRLIILLTIGLILQILVCYYYTRPYIRGE